MCDRNVKSEYILIKLYALVSEYICERTIKFHEKILFDNEVINIEIPMTKYLGFQYSVAYYSHLSLVGPKQLAKTINMVFSADDRVLIKVLRQEKGYGAKKSSQNFPASQIWRKLQERVSQPDS